MKTYYFAGGGTGGHIYPAIAVAEKIRKIEPDAKIIFFCSERAVDARILSGNDFEYITLPMCTFSLRPIRLIQFLRAFVASRRVVTDSIKTNGTGVLVGIGGFVSVAPVLIAKKLKLPLAVINIDTVPGKANRLLSRSAKQIFVQFEHTTKYFRRSKVRVVGCPLRDGFNTTPRAEVLNKLELSNKKQTLLITGASGGAVNVNTAIGFMIDSLNGFSDRWQIIHICGISNVETVRTLYKNAKINHKIFGFRDDMPALLSAADLVVGRAGALSIAEYVVSGTPSICLPYPYHKDNHQKLNAEQLAKVGACRIVTDLCDTEKTTRALWPVLSELMKSPEQLDTMRLCCEKAARIGAAEKIANTICSWSE